MRDLVFYVGSARADFSIISATFKQFNRLVELYFIPSSDDAFGQLDQPGPLPCLIFMSLVHERGPVLELLQHLKGYPDYRWIPVILIGSRGDQWSRDEVISSGAAALLTSPLEHPALLRIFSAEGDLLIYSHEQTRTLVGAPASHE